MKFLPPNLLAPILLCFVLSPADELRPAAREGLVLRKTFELETTRRFVSLELEMSGEPLPIPEGAGAGLSVSRRRVVAVRDTVVATAQGFATELERGFERLELAQTLRAGGPGEEEAVPLTARSPLAERCVRLAAAGGGWTARWCDDSLEEAPLLHGLHGALDLSELLPARAVSVGDSWTVPAAAWKVLHAPGGELAFAWDPAPEDAVARETQRMEAALLDGMTGELSATYRERDADVAVIALTGVIEARGTIGLGKGEDGAPFDAAAARRQSWRFELEGELRWDLAAGRARGLVIGGPLALRQSTTTTLTSQEGPRELVETMRFEGDIAHRVTFSEVR